MHGNDVRMRQNVRAAGFALKGNECVGVAAEIIVEHLDRNIRVRVVGLYFTQIFGPVDRAHTAGTEGRLKDKSLVQDDFIGSKCGIGRLLCTSKTLTAVLLAYGFADAVQLNLRVSPRRLRGLWLLDTR